MIMIIVIIIRRISLKRNKHQSANATLDAKRGDLGRVTGKDPPATARRIDQAHGDHRVVVDAARSDAPAQRPRARRALRGDESPRARLEGKPERDFVARISRRELVILKVKDLALRVVFLEIPNSDDASSTSTAGPANLIERHSECLRRDEAHGDHL